MLRKICGGNIVPRNIYSEVPDPSQYQPVERLGYVDTDNLIEVRHFDPDEGIGTPQNAEINYLDTRTLEF